MTNKYGILYTIIAFIEYHTGFGRGLMNKISLKRTGQKVFYKD